MDIAGESKPTIATRVFAANLGTGLDSSAVDETGSF
jgi:hypothetical protein